MTGWGGENLTVKRGGKTLLDRVTLCVEAGSMTALLGPNGSGKTTLLNVLAGLIVPDFGVIAGGTTRKWKENDWARMVACAFGPAPDEIPFCVEEVLLSSKFPDGGRWLDPSPERRQPLVNLLNRLEVFPEGGRAGLDRTYSTLSAGERQLIDVARAVLQPTPVLILDEPTSSLDLRHRLLVAQMLSEEARKRGRTVIISLHDLGEVDKAFGAAVVLHRGRLVATGKPGDILHGDLLAQVWGVAPMVGGFRLL